MYATQTEVSDGTLVVVNVGIEYFEQDDISVFLDLSDDPLVAGTDYTWTSATSIEFTNGPIAAGVTVLLRRETKADEMYNIYDGKAPFNRYTLDENFKQLLYRAQEFSEGLGISGINNNLDLNGYRIINLGNAVDTADAVNLGQLDAAVTEEASARQAADAALQDQLLGVTPPAGSQFSPISWHGQSLLASMTIPDNVNAWSFGPTMTIASGQSVTIGSGSFWTIADGAQTQEGPLVAEFPDNLDLGVLT